MEKENDESSSLKILKIIDYVTNTGIFLDWHYTQSSKLPLKDDCFERFKLKCQI